MAGRPPQLRNRPSYNGARPHRGWGAARRSPPRVRNLSAGRFLKDPGDDRLSRLWHYHGPGGLNGRVRDGNGWGPASMVAGNRPGGDEAPRPGDDPGSGHISVRACSWHTADHPRRVRRRMGRSWRLRSYRSGPVAIAFGFRPGPSAGAVGGGSGWSSRSAVRTGRLRRSPAVHSRPIDLVVFQEPSGDIPHGNLVSEGASRLDAFSAYPVPTWLPGGAPSGTAGTPEVGPPQSSRTRGDAPQVSHAHGR